jgi:hypothetical protein
VLEAVGAIDVEHVLAGLAQMVGAEFGHVRHALIPPSLAPAKWSKPIAALLEKFPFEANVFCMTRFPEMDDRDAQLRAGVAAAKEALASHGMVLHLASDRTLDDDVFGNVAAHMWACQYGLAFCEDRIGRGLNYNVILETGAMTLAGRRCGLLKDVTSPKLPTDLVGHIYKSVDFDDPASVARSVHVWLSDDLNLGYCKKCPRSDGNDGHRHSRGVGTT